MKPKELQIEYVKPNTIQTKFGEKTKYSIKDSNEVWYDCWENCSDLKQGDKVTGFVSEREYNGKKYYDFKRPKPVEEYILNEIKKLKKIVIGEEAEAPEPEIDVEDIPF